MFPDCLLKHAIFLLLNTDWHWIHLKHWIIDTSWSTQYIFPVTKQYAHRSRIFSHFPDLHSSPKQKASLVSSVHPWSLSLWFFFFFFSLLSLAQFSDFTMLPIWLFTKLLLERQTALFTYRKQLATKFLKWVETSQTLLKLLCGPSLCRRSVAFLGVPETVIFRPLSLFPFSNMFKPLFSIHPLTGTDQTYSFMSLIRNVSLELGTFNNPSGSEDEGPQIGEGTSFDFKLFHLEKKEIKGIPSSLYQAL